MPEHFNCDSPMQSLYQTKNNNEELLNIPIDDIMKRDHLILSQSTYNKKTNQVVPFNPYNFKTPKEKSSSFTLKNSKDQKPSLPMVLEVP